MKELKVGERVTITLEVVEHNTCEGCFFKGVAGQKSAGRRCKSIDRLGG